MSEKLQIENPLRITAVDFPATWRVRSHSHPTHAYFVNWHTGECDCPAGRHKKACKHVRNLEKLNTDLWKKVTAHMMKSQAGFKLLKEIQNAIQL